MYTSVERLQEAVGIKRIALEFLSKKIRAADSRIDSYLGTWYSLPLSFDNLATDEQRENLSAFLEELSISIAAHSLFAHSTTDVPKGIKISYDRAISQLKKLESLEERLPYVTPIRKTHFAVVGDRENEILPEFFSISRTFG
jgi:phage gp36-like protein